MRACSRHHGREPELPQCVVENDLRPDSSRTPGQETVILIQIGPSDRQVGSSPPRLHAPRPLSFPRVTPFTRPAWVYPCRSRNRSSAVSYWVGH